MKRCNYRVVTAASDIALEENHNFIFVLTPERLLYLLISNPSLEVDYLFVDEAHKLSGKNSRGPFYYKVVDMLLQKGFKKNAMTSGADEDESVGATADEIVEATRDFILKELSKNLKGYDLEEFVADLLRAMGYRTTVSAHGGDSGIDITAYKDELPPRILVQVKSQDSDIKEATIQSLKGAMREGDYGLFVTLSNYTKNAQKYLDSTPIIRGINGTELVDLILKYYHDLSDKYKKMIPLKMVYIPVAKDEQE